MEIIQSVFSMQGLISLLVVVIACFILVRYVKRGNGVGMHTKDVVAVGIGAALYGVLSMIALPIGPNTSFRLAIAILVIFGAIYGPIVGLLVGFIGHALNDAMMFGSIWWSWVFMSAVIGLFAGMIQLENEFDVNEGKVTKSHIMKLYIYSVIGMLVGSAVAYLGDVFLYGEPADKVWIQIILANLSNFAVIAVLGIPAVVLLAKRNKKIDLEKE